jgi:hypothetical protein
LWIWNVSLQGELATTALLTKFAAEAIPDFMDAHKFLEVNGVIMVSTEAAEVDVSAAPQADK